MTLASPVNFWHTAIIFIASVRAVNSAITPIVDLGYAQYEGVVNTDLNIASLFTRSKLDQPSTRRRPILLFGFCTIQQHRLHQRVYTGPPLLRGEIRSQHQIAAKHRPRVAEMVAER